MSSKLSSSLGSVSNIRFCKSAGKSMSSLIGVGTNGVFSYKVGFKQNNDNVYAFQVQFRKRSKYTNEKCKAKAIGLTLVPLVGCPSTAHRHNTQLITGTSLMQQRIRQVIM